jgi:adenosine deaminase
MAADLEHGYHERRRRRADVAAPARTRARAQDLRGEPVIEDFIRGIPKAELHVHLEGTLEPALVLELSARNGVDPPAAADAQARADCAFDDLAHFLRVYYAGVDVLRTERDFYDLTAAYLARAHADGVRHTEIFFDPQSHLPRGVPLADIVHGIAGALDEAERACGITSRLILCFLRDLGPEAARDTLRLALAHRDVIAGVGLDSVESGYPPGAFAAVFAEARDAGLAAVAHAGEEGPAGYIWEALDALQVRRIDHGVHAVDDAALVERLARERVPLTMCPLSNLHLQIVRSLEEHPLKRLLDAGVPVTVNSDDPAYFCGYLADNYLAIQRALRLTPADIRVLARNSIEASLLPPERVRELLGEIDAFAAGFGLTAV